MDDEQNRFLSRNRKFIDANEEKENKFLTSFNTIRKITCGISKFVVSLENKNQSISFFLLHFSLTIFGAVISNVCLIVMISRMVISHYRISSKELTANACHDLK
jgi:hypothetical protein